MIEQEMNHALLKKAIKRGQRQRRQPGYASRPRPQHLPPLENPPTRALHKHHPEAQRSARRHSTQHAERTPRGNSDNKVGGVLCAVSEYNNVKADQRASKQERIRGKREGTQQQQQDPGCKAPNEWYDNLERWMEAVDAPQGLPETLQDASEDAEIVPPDHQQWGQQGGEEKTVSRKRQLMGGRNKNKNTQPEASEMPAAAQNGPNPEMLAAMRSRAQRPDGALDTRPPAFGL